MWINKNRNEQFENINRIKTSFEEEGYLVISVDTKKKELLGEYPCSNDSLYGKEPQITMPIEFDEYLPQWNYVAKVCS